MIVIEQTLSDIFSYLPSMKYKETDTESFKPVFGAGDEKELNAFLKNKHKSSKAPYPLVWLLYPLEEIVNGKFSTFRNMTLILSVNTNSFMRNSERMNETFSKVLMPLLNNVNYCLTKSNVCNLDDTYSITKFPNYSYSNKGDEHAGTLIWDAIKVKYNLSVVDTCLNPIKF